MNHNSQPGTTSGGLRLRLLTFFTVIDVSVGFVSGMKEWSAATLLMVGMGYVVARKRIPWIALLAASILFFAVLSPMVAGYRAEIRSGSTSASLGDALESGMRSVLRGTDPKEGDLTQSVSRVRMIDNIAVIVAQTPQPNPYRPVSELLAAPVTSIIPRAIWPDKPVRLSGLEFYREYYGGEAYSSSAVTLPGSLYMYGGLIPLVVGSAALGMFIRGVDVGARASRSLHGSILISVLLPTLLKQETDFATLLASVPVFLMTYLISVALLFSNTGSDHPQNG